jgi:hypothetical protein
MPIHSADHGPLWRVQRPNRATTQARHPTILVSLFALTAPLLGCADHCDGHADGDFYCKGNKVMQCRQGYGMDEGACAPNECREPLNDLPRCVIPGLTCPTSNLGYQCMGERRIDCFANGWVADYGSCSSLSSQQTQYDEGPYCVENPGGDVLPCGWKREGCSVDGEVRCFEDGSAICRNGVYMDFRSNTEAGQIVCDVTKVVGCWEGRTWCEGDVLRRCDSCLDRLRCLKVSTEAICNPGACSAYQPPGWLVEATPQDRDYLPMGCTVAAPECVAGVSHACQNGAPVFCASPGVGVVAMSCEEIRSVTGRVYGAKNDEPTMVLYGPYCVAGSGSHQAICVLDPSPCVTPGFRCDPLDPTEKMIQSCSEDGYWVATWSCDNPTDRHPTQHCQSGSPFDWCQ